MQPELANLNLKPGLMNKVAPSEAHTTGRNPLTLQTTGLEHSLNTS